MDTTSGSKHALALDAQHDALAADGFADAVLEPADLLARDIGEAPARGILLASLEAAVIGGSPELRVVVARNVGVGNDMQVAYGRRGHKRGPHPADGKVHRHELQELMLEEAPARLLVVREGPALGRAAA